MSEGDENKQNGIPKNQTSKRNSTVKAESILSEKDKPVIDDKEFLITQTKIMRLSLLEALAYLEVHGYKMKRAAYFVALKKISQKINLRAMEIASRGLLEIHMKMIDTLTICERSFWNNYHMLANDPYKQSQVIKLIVEMQPYLTAAYNKTRVVMEKQAEMRSKMLSEN